MKDNEFILSKRKHVCLITNHGYAGVNIPIGGAPDTGGQVIYVNEYAKSLDSLGFKVTVFARGGFPFFNTKKIRKGSEYISEYARYVYIPCGGEAFIPKEDIGNVLDEEVEWVYAFINKEAAIRKVKPCKYFLFINSHYWDAAIIALKLIKRWQNDIFIEKIKKIKFNKNVIKRYDLSRHKLRLGNHVNYFTGEMFFQHVKDKINSQLPDNVEILNYRKDLIMGLKEIIGTEDKIFNIYLRKIILETRNVIKPVVFTFFIEKIGEFILQKKCPDINNVLKKINTNVWTPHSLGALKERNYWDKDFETKRRLKFLERNSYEQYVINNSRAIVATSEEIIRVFSNYYNASLEKIIYFPPGINETTIKPRGNNECKKTWQFLSNITHIKKEELMNKKIIFETSRMDYTKRKDILIKAFSLISDQYKDVLLVIGGGPENKVYNELKVMVKKFKLKDKVFITGFIPEEFIAEMFSIATIFASASEMEGFGISVLNAVSSKVPVISSNLIPVTVQYLQDCSLIVPAGDVNKFAESMKKYLDDDKLRNQYAEKSFRISSHLKWRKLVQQLIKDLQESDIV